MPYKDPEARKKYQREWARKKYGGKVPARTTQRRREMVEWFREEVKRNYACAHCGEDDPICIDFHHLDPTQKEGNVSSLLSNLNKEAVLREIEKCVPLCANCHRKEHRRLCEDDDD